MSQEQAEEVGKDTKSQFCIDCVNKVQEREKAWMEEHGISKGARLMIKQPKYYLKYALQDICADCRRRLKGMQGGQRR